MEDHTIKLALVTISFTSNYTMHEVILLTLWRETVLFLFFPKRSDLSCAHNEENSSNTEMTNVKYTSLPDRNTHGLHNHFPQLNR